MTLGCWQSNVAVSNARSTIIDGLTSRPSFGRIAAYQLFIHQRRAVYRSIAVILFLTLGGLSARADSCASVVPGAQMGPSPNFNGWPWRNACYVSWPGGYINGSNARFTYEPRCRAVPGFLHFEGDRGSNRNTCIFSAPTGASAPRHDDDEALRKSIERLRADEAERASEARANIKKQYDKIREMDRLLRQSYDSKNWQRVYDVSSDIKNEYDGFEFIMNTGNVGPAKEIEQQTCIRELAAALNSPRVDISVPSECAAHRNVPMIQDMLARKRMEDESKTPAAGDLFGVMVFAGNTSFFGASVKKKTLGEAYIEAVSNCEAMVANTSSFQFDRMLRCNRFYWFANACISTALTDDDKEYVARFVNNDLAEGLRMAMDTCRSQTSSTVCRAGPRICSVNR